MSQEELKKMRELDEAAEIYGGFTAPFSDKDVHYDYRKISRYFKGNTAQRTPDGFARHLLAYFPSSRTNFV